MGAYDVRPDVNRSAVLAHLAANGPVSRAQLARSLRVSPGLMSQLTRQLIADGLLIELDESVSEKGRGRPGRLLGLNVTAGGAIGVRLAPDHATLVELRIDSSVIRTAREPIESSSSTYLTDLVRLLRSFVDGTGHRTILGIGVGVPGVVDDQSNGVVDSSSLGVVRAPVGSMLQRELGLPVIVENDVNALAVGERLYGLGRHHDTFMVLTVGSEIGSAFVIDGMIYRGASGAAGDIAHVPVVDGGPPCVCGNRGCLQAVVGQAALVERARESGAIGPRGTITALGSAADAGDPRAQAVFSEAGHALGRAVAGVAQAFDPEIVIVLGEATASWTHWSFGFEPAFQSAFPAGRRGLPVVAEAWQDVSWAQGAAALVFATPFDVNGVAGDQGRLVRQRLSSPSPADSV